MGSVNNKIIAHRGASNCAKENTIEAYEKAIEIGAEFIEFDVRITKDGVLISHHDPMIANQAISQLTFAEINPIAGQQGFRVPTVAVRPKGDLLAHWKAHRGCFNTDT